MGWLHTVIDVPASPHAAASAFWSEGLGWPAGESWPGHPELRSFEPPDGAAYVHLQEIDGAPRVHLDVESPEPEASVSRAVELGAALAGRQDDAGSPLQLLFQRLDEVEGPVRAHLDHGTDDLEAEVRRMLGLGAVDVGRGHGGWHVLEDPVGQAFCVTENPPDQVRHRPIS